MNNLIKYFYFLIELLGMDAPELIIKTKNICYDKNGRRKKFATQSTKGRTLFRENYRDPIIFIDLDKHANNDEYLSLTHELRHVYQVFAIQNENIEPKRITDAWKKELTNYKSFGDDNYNMQEIELDANAFTAVIALKVFKREVNTNFKNKQFYKYYNYIDNDFSEQEIAECLYESDFKLFLN